MWLITPIGTAHFFPTAKGPSAGHYSACHGWVSTTADAVEGDVKEWCPTCWDRCPACRDHWKGGLNL